MIALGNDHGGFGLKTEIIRYLEEHKIEYKDYGAYSSDVSVDYPDYGRAAAVAVASGECEKGIIICGTGIGISIAANKVPGIRAALCCDGFSARMSREHNNANMLALGERVIGKGLALDIVEIWLNTSFAGGRHQGRVEKISSIECMYSGDKTTKK